MTSQSIIKTLIIMNVFRYMVELSKNKINLKYEKMQENYFPLLQFKGVFLKKDKMLKSRHKYTDYSDKKYNNYIIQIIKLDNEVKDYSICYQLNNNLLLDNKYNSLIIINNKNKVTKLFNNNFYSEYYKNKTFQYERNNIFKEHINFLNSRKISHKLTVPYYFFTTRYNEKSWISQIKNWTSSVYNFNKDEKRANNFLDLYTSKLIKLFFTIKYIKRKKIWNLKITKGFKIMSDISIFKMLTNVLRYTSIRTVLCLKKLDSFSSYILKYKWLEEQINESNFFNKVINFRKNELFSGYYPKKKDYFRRLTRILISKPLFKHTSYNVIIDLFVFNNKTYKIRLLKNIINRRSLYKYMYSMYVNYSFKIKETISRPRFFYINLIEPKVYHHYYWVIRWYELLIFKYQDSLLKKIFLLKSQLNFIHINKNSIIRNKVSNLQTIFYENAKNYLNIGFKDILQRNIRYFDKNNLMSLNREEDNFNISYLKKSFLKYDKNNNNSNIKLYLRNCYLKEINRNNLNKYYNIIKKSKSYAVSFYNKRKFLINLKNDKFITGENEKRLVKSIKDKNSKYYLYNKYLTDLEKKSNIPFDLSTLTMWSRKGLGRKKIVEKKIRVKNFRHDKYSYSEFKKRNFYKNGKRISPKKWGKKLMGFFLFSKKQKKDTNPNKIFFNKYNQKILFNKDYINSNQSYFDKKRDTKHLNYIIKNIKDSIIILKGNQTEETDMKNLMKEEKIESIKLKGLLTNEEDYIQKINLSNFDNKNFFNNLFDKFYFYRNNNKLNNNNNEERKKLIVKLEKSSINYKTNKKLLKINKNIKDYLNSFKVILDKNIEEKFRQKERELFLFDIIKKNFVGIFTKSIKNKLLFNYKYNSSENVFSKFLNIKNNMNFNKRELILHNINSRINNIVGNEDIWYILYYFNYVKKEFFKIKKDILETKSLDVIYNNNNENIDNYNNNYENVDKIYNNINFTKVIKYWRSYYLNKREGYLSNKLNFNENIFKPYYRYMIPIIIFESYYYFISLLGFRYSIFDINKSLINKRNDVISDNTFIFNFVLVKTLLDLLRYNYRSLIRIKPKYYYLNKLRLYTTKFNKLNNNTWTNSLKYLISLKRTPKKFWLRHRKVASYYYTRIQENSGLDTRRKTLLPFVLYFEDILFNIYGKWGLIRLWPMRKYFLSSYILANRILLLMVWRGKHQKYRYDFQDITAKLISAFRALQIRKAYHHYHAHNFRWPNYLINKINNYNNIIPNYTLNYSNLELFLNKIDKNDTLNTYPLLKSNLSNYLSIVSSKYINIFNNYLNKIKVKKVKNRILKDIKNYEISRLQYSYYLLKPLKNYLINIKRYLDISGIKFLIKGRTGIKRNNLRSVYKTRFYGSLIGPNYITHKLIKNKTMYIPHTKNYIKSNIDYTRAISKSKNGSISLKIWISSIISSDIHELLLHLLHIKNLYIQIINRYYIIDVNFLNIKNYYSFNSVKNKIKNIKMKNMRKKKKDFI